MRKCFSEGSNLSQKLWIQSIHFFASFLLLIILFLVQIHATVLEQEKPKSINGTNNNGGPPSAEYQFIWSDEFNNIELDTTIWNYRKLGPRREAIYVKNMVRLDGNGHLVLSTRRVGEEIHTAMIKLDPDTNPINYSRYDYNSEKIRFFAQQDRWCWGKFKDSSENRRC